MLINRNSLLCMWFFSLIRFFMEDRRSQESRVNLLPSQSCDLIPGWANWLKTCSCEEHLLLLPLLGSRLCLLRLQSKRMRAGVGAADVCRCSYVMAVFCGGVTAPSTGGGTAPPPASSLIYLPPQLPAFTDNDNQVLFMARLLSLLLLLLYCIDLSVFASVTRSEKWENLHVSLYHELICVAKIHFLDLVCLHHFISCQPFFSGC